MGAGTSANGVVHLKAGSSTLQLTGSGALNSDSLAAIDLDASGAISIASSSGAIDVSGSGGVEYASSAGDATLKSATGTVFLKAATTDIATAAGTAIVSVSTTGASFASPLALTVPAGTAWSATTSGQMVFDFSAMTEVSSATFL